MLPLLETYNDITKKDIFKQDAHNTIIPPENFVISRKRNGDILSIYSDDSWDLSPYSTNPTNSSKIKFKNRINDPKIEQEAKRLIFLLLSLGKGVAGSSYSVATIIGYATFCIFPISLFALNKKLTINNVLSNTDLLLEFTNSSFTNKTYLYRFYGFLGFMSSIDNNLSGFEYEENKKFLSQLKLKIKSVPEQFNQTSIIPLRIFSESLKLRWQQIDLISCNIGLFIDFLEYKKQADFDNIKLIFKIKNKLKFQKYLREIQGTCKHLIHAYTGMRSSEVMNLKVNSLKEENHTYRIFSTTSKLEGRYKKVSWITSKEIKKVIQLLESLNVIAYKKYNIPKEYQYLFINHLYILGKYTSFNEKNIKAKNFEKDDSIAVDIKISNDDINELEAIEPFRDWESEKNFKIGNNWVFKSHQYRRSLVVYSIQSGLVSLGSLQNQLKHLFREMTLYYAKGTSFSNHIQGINNNHLIKEIKNAKDELDTLAYIKNVLFSDEKLFGTHGKVIENEFKNKTVEFKTFFLENREKTIKQFKNGVIAYKETPLGGCIAIEACDSRLLRSVTACFDCYGAILKPSKVDNVIQKQTKFLEFLDKDSIEYKTELDDLKTLKEMKNKLIKDSHGKHKSDN